MTTTTPTPADQPPARARHRPGRGARDPGAALPSATARAGPQGASSDDGEDRSAVSVADWRRPRVQRYARHACTWLLLVAARRLVRRPAAAAGQVRRHARRRTSCARRWRSSRTASTWSNLSEAWNDVADQQVLRQHDRARRRVVVRADARRDDRRLRAVGAAAALGPVRCRRLVLATLFVPAVVLLVPLYLIILHPPVIDTSLVNSYLGASGCRPARARSTSCSSRGSSTTSRARSSRPPGSTAPGPFRLFWSIVLPMSKPILGVVSVFAVIASWKDFLWPLLVLRNPDLQPLSVRLPSIEATTDKGDAHGRPGDLDAHPDRACSSSSSACSCAAPARAERSRAERRAFLTTRPDNLTGPAGPLAARGAVRPVR